jgi:hypothetical protein
MFLETINFATSSEILVRASFGTSVISVSKSAISSVLYLLSFGSDGLKYEVTFKSPHPVIDKESRENINGKETEYLFLFITFFSFDLRVSHSSFENILAHRT